MPKGVELTHKSLLWSLQACHAARVIARPDDRVLSYLPDAHLANRIAAHYTRLVHGTEITTVANVRDVLAGLVEVRPQMFLGVPQTWYKIKTGIETALAAEPDQVKRDAAAWALDVAARKVRAEQAGQQPGAALLAEHAEAERLVLAPLRVSIGLDQIWLPVSGAAPLSPEAHEFMMKLGVPVREAWAMTESSAGATTNPPDDIRIGTVGKALPGVEMKVADDGELLLRGKLVMRGYRKDPEKTAEAIDADGWLHTGDIGTIDADGYVTIVDRKKDLIINSSGKNMSPANIENAVLDACPLAGVVAAIADQRPFVSMLIVLDPDAAAAFAAEHGFGASPATLATSPEVLAAIQAGIDKANTKLSKVEHVRAFTILPEHWLPGSEVLTPTMKVRRKPVAEIYASEIDAMYAR